MARPYVVISPEQGDLILSMYSDGYSVHSIWEATGKFCSEGKIISWLKANGHHRGPQKGTRHIDCEACGKDTVVSHGRKFCETCIPTRNALQRYRLYLITQPEFDEMLLEQSGLCAMCSGDLPEDTDKIHVDHCHKQGHVRGLLCGRCNNGLAYVEDDKFLANAVRYVELHRR